MTKSANKKTDLMNPNGLNDSSSVAKPTVPTTDVFTSYIFSTSNRSLSKYGERLLMEVISVAQEFTVDAAFGINKLNFGEKYKEKFAVIDIPVKNLLNSDDTTNYTKAKEAALELMKIYHTVEAPVFDEVGNPKYYKDGSPQYQFASYHLLDKVYVNQKPGIVSVKLGEDTWSQILDMGKGYTRYNLITAKSLNDVVAIRLFQILSNTSEPLHFSIERIKGILGLSDKYKNNAPGFVHRVIEPAEAEIKAKCPFEVVHELVYAKPSGRGRPSLTGLVFSKVLKPTIIQNPAVVLDSHLINFLVKNFGFDDRGIRSNMKLFMDLKDADIDIESFLSGIADRARQAHSPQAYAIRSLQNLLKGKKPAVVKRTLIKADALHPNSAGSVIVGETTPKKTRQQKDINVRLKVNDSSAFLDSGMEEI